MLKFVKDVSIVRHECLSCLPHKKPLIDMLRHALSGDQVLAESALVLLRVVLETRDPDLYVMVKREGMHRMVVTGDPSADYILTKYLENAAFRAEMEEERFEPHHRDQFDLAGHIEELIKLGPELGSSSEMMALLLQKLHVDALTAHELEQLKFPQFIESLLESKELDMALISLLRNADNHDLYQGFNHFVRSLQIMIESAASASPSSLRLHSLISSGSDCKPPLYHLSSHRTTLRHMQLQNLI